jgi:hypothetical protein
MHQSLNGDPEYRINFFGFDLRYYKNAKEKNGQSLMVQLK